MSLQTLAFGFLSPWLMAAGGAATSIPIIIHLLNKRKFRIIIWAAMEWLLAAQRRNARRLKFHRWLLLAIRCLAILLIAAGIAQLVLQTTAIGSLLGEQHAVIIIWDDSYSMGYQQGADGGRGDGAATAFERSKRLLTDYVTRLKSGDTVMLIRASTGGTAESANLKPTPDHQAVISQINNTPLTDAATDLPTAFDRARQVLSDIEKTTRWRQLLLVTDCSNSTIHDPRRGLSGGTTENTIEGVNGDKLKKAAQGAIAHTTNGNDFLVRDVGVDTQVNMAVTGLVSKRPVVVAGVPADMQVEVFNGSDRPELDVGVSVLVDGVAAQTIKIPRIEPASFQKAEASVTVATAGRHLVEARLGRGDLLAVDDTRRLMLNVRKEIPVLLVDGSPGDGGRTSFGSTFYLWAVYPIPEVKTTGDIFGTKIISELELPTTPLAGYDVIVLSDTSDPGPATRDALRKFVADGGLLMVFPGTRTDAQRMNEALGPNGAGLLPATFGQPDNMATPDQAMEGKAFAAENFQKNDVMRIFAADYAAGKEPGFLTARTMRYLKLGVPADGSVETVLRYAEKDGTPGDAAIVLKRGAGADPAKGEPGGSVVQFASTADMTWTTWPGRPSFVPFVYELTFYAMSRASLNAGAGLTLDVGGALHLPGDAAAAGPWIGPHDSRLTVTQDVQEGRSVLNGPTLHWAGVYGPVTGDVRPVVAVNPEVREADIRHVQKERMAAALGTDVRNVLDNPSMIAWQSSAAMPGSWLGPSLVLAALGLFFLETILALAFSTYR
jgi:hypothetical protein